MQRLIEPLEILKKNYIKNSTFIFDEINKDLIIKNHTCDTITRQAENLKNYINSKLNSENRINAVKTLLFVVKLFQEKATNDQILPYQNRIGTYVDPAIVNFPTSIVSPNSKPAPKDDKHVKPILSSLNNFTDFNSKFNKLKEINNIEYGTEFNFIPITDMIMIQIVNVRNNVLKFKILNSFNNKDT